MQNAATNTPWRKSSRSMEEQAECVEVAALRAGVTIRDSKDPAGAVLRFRSTVWATFILAAKDGHHDLKP